MSAADTTGTESSKPAGRRSRELAEAHAYAEAARDAAHRFIGRFGVCGVGLTHFHDRHIVFLLAHESRAARTEIERWAETASVRIAIRVSRPR
jgi:hypothetical protein